MAIGMTVGTGLLVGLFLGCGQRDAGGGQSPVHAGVGLGPVRGQQSGQDPQAQDPQVGQDPKQNPEGDAKTKPAVTQDPKELLAEMMARFKEQKIAVDLEAHTVAIPVVLNLPQDPVEYLLIHRRGKRHEAMFVTEAKPSLLNGALLLAGLQIGKNARVRDVEPMPSLEEVQNGAETVIVTPPKGQPFWMTARWANAAGKVVEHCIEDLILDLTTQEPITDCQWIYIGGRMARLYKNDPEVYVADFEGNIVSICYMLPDNHLATMRHASARDDQNWWLSDLVPEPGTEAQLIFHAQKSKLHVARDERLAAEAKKKSATDGGK